MTIYSSTNYRQIYEQTYGIIPKDADGRTHEIHHIDNNHINNNPSNLVCVSIQEHYNIHLAQGDHGACYYIGLRMDMSPVVLSELSRKRCEEWVAAGVHPWQTRSDGTSLASDRVAAGVHPWLKENAQHTITSEKARQLNSIRVHAGNHNFLRRPDGSSIASERDIAGLNPLRRRPDGSSVTSDNVKNGTHPFLKKNAARRRDHRIDTTSYQFVNTTTNKIICSTRYDFYTVHQPDMTVQQVFRMVHHPMRVINGWYVNKGATF